VSFSGRRGLRLNLRLALSRSLDLSLTDYLGRAREREPGTDGPKGPPRRNCVVGSRPKERGRFALMFTHLMGQWKANRTGPGGPHTQPNRQAQRPLGFDRLNRQRLPPQPGPSQMSMVRAV
jgi:hypothetical protein